jgi:hypothetical protein
MKYQFHGGGRATRSVDEFPDILSNVKVNFNTDVHTALRRRTNPQ